MSEKLNVNREFVFNNFMHMTMLFLFTIAAVAFHGMINTNNKNVDKIVEIVEKANVECSVRTNKVLYVEVRKIVD